jgi:bifunctional DNA-binding transcriptional regulator/antitoxin component of YhaV-PrlF toxin-antitoxin module
MDTQQRVVVPVAARNRFELRNGESVLIVTAKEPVAHVRIIPMTLVLAGLTELETKS